MVGGLEHGDVDAVLGQADGGGEPVGPAPTTTAVLMRTGLGQLGLGRTAVDAGEHGSSGSRSTSSGIGPVGQPRLLGDGVGDLVGAALDDAEGGVDDLVLLVVLVDRLRLDPGHHELAGLEVAPPLDRLDELLVVEVAVAEVEPDDRVAAELGLTERVAVDVVAEVLDEHREQRAAPGCASTASATVMVSSISATGRG